MYREYLEICIIIHRHIALDLLNIQCAHMELNDSEVYKCIDLFHMSCFIQHLKMQGIRIHPLNGGCILIPAQG